MKVINKKIVLGKVPEELGVKDAVHVAIISVRAARRIELGQKCSLNKYGEAEPDGKGIGVADPFRRQEIYTGDYFILLINPDVVDNVTHHWEHPSLAISQPTREVVYNRTLSEYAKQYKLTYKELMDAAEKVVNKDTSVPYTGELTEEEFDEVYLEKWEFWSEWAGEVGYEFENQGTECCPEYNYPDNLFFFKGK